VKTAHAGKLASRVGLSATSSPEPPGQQSDWARIRQGYEVVLPDRNDLVKGGPFHRNDIEAKDNVGDLVDETGPASYSARRNSEPPGRQMSDRGGTNHAENEMEFVGHMSRFEHVDAGGLSSSGIVPERFRPGR
jgi:hypothetical protein